MAEQRVSCLIIDSEALQPGREGMSKIMKMEILYLRQLADANPIFLERSDIIPTPEYSPVGN